MINQNTKKIIKPVVLFVLSGWGIGRAYEGNAISKANTPNFDKLVSMYPSSVIDTSKNEFGASNSKLSHIALGSGRDAKNDEKRLKNTLSEVIANNNLKQAKIAETEKYGCATYFFNGMNEKFENEDQILIPAFNKPNCKLNPRMSIEKIVNELNRVLESECSFILVNFANIDALTHSGNFKNTIEAVEIVDKYLGKAVKNVIDKRGIAIITSDHGNAESMVNMQSEIIETNHTTNPVPLIIAGNCFEGKTLGWTEPIDNDLSMLKPNGSLIDVAPTILKIIKLEKPKEMEGGALITN